MFASNNKVSLRQIKYLLIMEGIGRVCILLPVCLEGKTLGSMILCLMLGAAVWGVLFRFLFSWMEPGETMYFTLSRKFGKAVAVCIYGIGFLFFLAQSAVFLNIISELASAYLLPEVPIPVLCLLPLGAGLYLGWSQIEVRGRFCEVIGPVVLFLMGILTFAAAFGMGAYEQESTLVRLEDHLILGGLEVFAVLGGMFWPMLRSEGTGIRRAVNRAGMTVLVLGGSLCIIAAASYGKNGIGAISFPAVRVMSNTKIPGGFLQRWDVLFLGLLLMGLFVTVGSSFWYMREILRALGREAFAWKKQRNQEYVESFAGADRKADFVWMGSILLAYLMAAGFLNEFTAICYYRGFNLQILVPLLALIYGLMTAGKKAGEKAGMYRRATKAFVFLVVLLGASLLLGGCTAREPEERLFPMALQIESGPGEILTVTYAWDEENGPANAEHSLTKFQGSSLFDIQTQVAAFTERQVDYSHVKALLLDENLEDVPKLEAEVIQWFSGEPAFASGLIVYPLEKSGLTLVDAAQKSSGQIGTYLEMLYENNRSCRESSTTLGRILAEYFA